MEIKSNDEKNKSDDQNLVEGETPLSVPAIGRQSERRRLGDRDRSKGQAKQAMMENEVLQEK